MICLNIDLKSICKHEVSTIPPWTRHDPLYNYELAADKKASTNPDVFKSKYNEIKDRHQRFNYLYTDGSKDAGRVAAAVVSENGVLSCRLPDQASIFTAELTAIDLALDMIEDEGYWRYIIFTDSLSAMQALDNNNVSFNPLITNILNRLSVISENCNIVFCWLPSHIGIIGNEKADRAAKAALSGSIVSKKIPFSDFKPCINSFIHDVWQRSWSSPDNANNKLFEIKPILSESVIFNMSRREEVVLSRLRIGHSYLTHSFLLKKEVRPQCTHCDEPLTIRHIILSCQHFASIRRRFYNVNNLSDLFSSCTYQLLEFLKEINLFYKI